VRKAAKQPVKVGDRPQVAGLPCGEGVEVASERREVDPWDRPLNSIPALVPGRQEVHKGSAREKSVCVPGHKRRDRWRLLPGLAKELLLGLFLVLGSDKAQAVSETAL
jgi:hypothetical protein